MVCWSKGVECASCLKGPRVMGNAWSWLSDVTRFTSLQLRVGRCIFLIVWGVRFQHVRRKAAYAKMSGLHWAHVPALI